MPEYLAPGVYVEETSFRAKSIEGASTSTTAFVGPTLKGPIGETPELITSFGNFERIYGGFQEFQFAGGRATNFIAHAVQSYFANGGSRLYVSRVFNPGGDDDEDGVARSELVGSGDDDDNKIRFISRSAGALGNGSVTVELVATPATARSLERAPEGSLLRTDTTTFVKSGAAWSDSEDEELEVPEDPTEAAPDNGQIVTLNLLTADATGDERFYEGMGLAPGHPRYVGAVLNPNPGRRIDALENAFAIDVGDGVTPHRLHEILSASSEPIALEGGTDGAEPAATHYATALELLLRIDDVSIVAAPGHSVYDDFKGIQDSLVTHVETDRYRVAVLDTQPGSSGAQAPFEDRSTVDSTYAAIYHPWIVVSNPLARPGDESIRRELELPPSGFICGVYARNDVERGVAKAPANEVVRGALRLSTDVSFGEQQTLNPRGVNCLRFFPGRGFRVWGARTTSSDPEWKYVNVRRYFVYLEKSIDRGTQWAVFENNGERLWANVRETISGFLYNEWKTGSLLGTSPKEAFFVRCDRSTMTQNDLDNGRLVCLIGVAVLKPAEFVVFRIGQKTADARS